MTKSLILNAQVVNEGRVQALDVLIENERIARIGTDLQHLAADHVVDATGLYLMPGMIDDQVHFREPGLSAKGSIVTESAAAVAGGITSYMEMPNVSPPTLTNAAVAAKMHIAAAHSRANYAFYLGASHDNLDEIKAADPRTTCGVKEFMGASTGNLLVDDPVALEAIFGECPILIVTHCEDGKVIAANQQRLALELTTTPAGAANVVFEPKHHPLIRDSESCYASSALAVSLAKKYGSQLHVLHLTTAKELALFSSLPLSQKHITAEVCVHHLRYSDADYGRLGYLLKCNPAVKSVGDRDALRRALADNRLDIIATDHAPHLLSEKLRPYSEAPAGLPLVQHALLSAYALVAEGVLTLPQLVQKTAHAPAERYAVAERGVVREGYFADLVLLDGAAQTLARNDTVLYRCGWTPLHGETLQGAIHSTYVNGALCYTQGRMLPRATGRQQPTALRFLRG